MKKIVTVLLITTLFASMVSGCTLFCEHTFSEANCCQPATCTLCGKTEGEVGEHSWISATCTEAKKCKLCNQTEGKSLGHRWVAATCTNPKKCYTCGVTSGSALNHSWKSATCTNPKTCTRCYKVSGSALGHNIVNYSCTRCDYSKLTKSDIPNILDITRNQYEINSVGGIDIYMTFKNKSDKTIKYIYLDLYFYNSVGDIIYNEIGGDKYASLQYTGPLAKNKSEKAYWRACFYNSTFGGTMGIEEITIMYMDGSSLKLNKDVAHYAVVAWR